MYRHQPALAAIVMLTLAPAAASAQVKPSPGYEYDAREFLSTTQRAQFKRQYPGFDGPRTEKNWEWKDVDPLGLLSPAENCRRRRELFLMEYSVAALPDDGQPSDEQLAFEPILETQIEQPTIRMSAGTLKISAPYTGSYERDLPTRNLLEKISQIGLQWAQLGGTNVYIYNGPILLARYRHGLVSLVERNIDRPPAIVKRGRPQ